jgi:hypothetical protein
MSTSSHAARQHDPVVSHYDPVISPVSTGRVTKPALLVSSDALTRPLCIAPPDVHQASLWTGVATSSVFLTVQMWIRLKVFRRLQPSDPFVIVAWLLSICTAAIQTAISADLSLNLALANSLLVEIPPHFLEPHHAFNPGQSSRLSPSLPRSVERQKSRS